MTDAIDGLSGAEHRTSPRRALIVEELERILASRAFGRSLRHRAFLRYIVDAALDADYGRLKESTIALEVFRRHAAQFDSATDSIVRVEASRVRQKLKQYYVTAGGDSAMTIEMVAGNYRPRFIDGVAPHVAPRYSMAGRPLFLPKLPEHLRAGYDRAWYLMRARTLEGYRKALEIFEEAILKHPEFAAAHRSVAWARINIAGHQGVPREAGDQSHAMAAAIARAHEIEPDNPEMNSLRGAYVTRFRFDLGAADELFSEGLRRDPESRGARSAYAWLLILLGRFHDARELVEAEFASDPFAFFMRHNFGSLAYYERDFERSKRDFTDALDLEPGHLVVRVGRASTLIAMGEAAAAVSELTQVCAANPELSGLALMRVRALASARLQAEARTALADINRRFVGQYVSPVYRAAAHLALDERNVALDWLERASLARDYWLPNVMVDPAFDSVRNEARFTLILEGAGLAKCANAIAEAEQL
ncbi:MAG: hypothetical protein ABI607_00315 [Betaproteobacteria bacterium]